LLLENDICLVRLFLALELIPIPISTSAAIGDFATLILQKALKDLVYGVGHRSPWSPRNHPEHPYTAGTELRLLGTADADASMSTSRMMRGRGRA
jgi:hypothetical protein